jgi:DNA-binding MurR/RpiR family transcriptional regulator
MSVKLYQNETWLKKRIQIDKKTPQEVAKECGASVATIYNYMEKFGLRKRKR